MITNASIGTTIKTIRTQKKYTLKQLSESTGLSTGFLSQFERGISTIAVDALAKIAAALEVPLQSLLSGEPEEEDIPVLHSYEQYYTKTSPYTLECNLSKIPRAYEMYPRLIQLLPVLQDGETETEVYSHTGEEYIYVLEGALCVSDAGTTYDLFAGDGIHISSADRHNWSNRSQGITKILVINCPNPFRTEK